MDILHKAIIKKLERLCKEKLRACQSSKHQNSELIFIRPMINTSPVAYMKCKDCGSTYARNATEEEIKYFITP